MLMQPHCLISRLYATRFFNVSTSLAQLNVFHVIMLHEKHNNEPRHSTQKKPKYYFRFGLKLNASWKRKRNKITKTLCGCKNTNFYITSVPIFLFEEINNNRYVESVYISMKKCFNFIVCIICKKI